MSLRLAPVQRAANEIFSRATSSFTSRIAQMTAPTAGLRMSAYRLWATLLALWYRVKGERYQGPGYAANAKRKVRRSLTDLGESFACGWKEMQDGKYANALMVYAATIGEFHPLKPVIDNYLERDPGMP